MHQIRRRTARLLAGVAFTAIAAALLASSALALTPEYLIGVESFAELGVKEENTSSTGGSVTISIPGKSITVECKASSGSGKAFEGGTDENSISLSKCAVTKGEGCTANETISLKVKTELIQAGSFFYRKVIAKEGETLGTLTLNGEKCEMAGENKITGAVAAEISLDPLTAEPLKTSETISKTTNEKLKAEEKPELILKVGSQSASLTSEFSQKLSGENSGKEWQNAVGTQLCTNVPANNGRCMGGNVLGVPTTLKAENEGNYSLVYNRTATCQELKMEGPTTAAGAAVFANLSTLTIGVNQCGTCTVTPESGPWRVTFTVGNQANGSGTMRLANATLKSVCAGETCIYEELAQPFIFTGGTPAKIKSDPVIMTSVAGSAGTCDITAKWEAAGGGQLKFKFPTPGTMFVTP
jgi:hypothetical protein